MKKNKKGQVDLNTHTILIIALGLAVFLVMLFFIFHSSDSSNTLLDKIRRMFIG